MVIFALLTWGIAFLLADAKIFGCSTQEYKMTLHADERPEEATYLLKHGGIWKFRNFFLKNKFFQEMLGCYFCLGFWCGLCAHVLLHYASKHHFIQHAGTFRGWALGLTLAGILGAVLSYLVNLIIGILENLQEPQ